METTLLQASAGNSPAMKMLISFIETENRRADNIFLGCTPFANFPIYRDLEGDVVTIPVMFISPTFHVVILSLCSDRPNDLNSAKSILLFQEDEIDKVVSNINSRLLRNKLLRSSKTQLRINIAYAIYSPFYNQDYNRLESDTHLLKSDDELRTFFSSIQVESLTDDISLEIISTLDGSKGLSRQRNRLLNPDLGKTKGKTVADLEAEITTFDRRQLYRAFLGSCSSFG